jgi:hypothetical protein
MLSSKLSALVELSSMTVANDVLQRLPVLVLPPNLDLDTSIDRRPDGVPQSRAFPSSIVRVYATELGMNDGGRLILCKVSKK